MNDTETDEIIRAFGTRYQQESLMPIEVDEEVEYKRSKIPIGIERFTNKVVSLDTSEAMRIVMFGATRVGKTWLIRSFADRLRKTGCITTFIPDIKNEFWSSSQELQPKFKKFLLKNEKPEGFKIMSLRPTYFSSYSATQQLPHHSVWYSPEIQYISPADIKTLINYEDIKGVQASAVEMLVNKLDRMKNDKQFITSMEQVLGLIDLLPDEFSDQTKRSLKLKFYPMITDKFFDAKHRKDVVKAINNGISPALVLEDFELFGRDKSGYYSVVISILLRTINSAVRHRQIKRRVWHFIDEASRVIPKNRETSCKLDVMESVDLDSRYGINYCFATQSMSKFPEEIISQCRYIMVPHGFSAEDVKQIFKVVGNVKSVYTASQEVNKLMSHLQKHEWLLIDKYKIGRKHTIFKPLAPLSNHAETNN